MKRGALIVACALVLTACTQTPVAPPTIAPPTISSAASATVRPTPSAFPTLAPAVTLAPLPPSTARPAAAGQFDGARAYDWVVRQNALGPRITGSKEIRALGDQILAELSAQGWQTRTQEFVYHDTPVRNIVATKGSGSEAVLLGAHYDTRRRADQDPVHPDQPVPGANDGASGAAVLLELARSLDVSKAGKQVWLAFFDAEDNGDLDGWDWIVGSRYFADHITSTMPVSPSAVVVVDMVGDAQQDIYLERNSNQAVAQQIWSVAKSLGYENQIRPQVKWSMMDDHTPFAQRGLRAVDMIDFDYPYWHRTTDTPDKVSAQSLERVGRTLQTWLER